MTQKFETTARQSARAIVSAEGGVAKGLAMLTACFTEQGVTEKKGKPYVAISAAWRNEYETKKECSEEASRKAWGKYSTAALAGDTTLERSQNRPVKAKGSSQGPKLQGHMPAHIVATNKEAGDKLDTAHVAWDGEPAKVIPLSARQSLALNVNKAQADMAECDNMIADIKPDMVPHFPALLAAFQSLRASLRAVEKSAVKVCS